MNVKKGKQANKAVPAKQIFTTLIHAVVMLSLTACAQKQLSVTIDALPEPERKVHVDEVPKVKAEKEKKLRIESIPMMTAASAARQQKASGITLPAGKLTVNADALALNRFIHLALVDVLKLTIDIDPAVAKRIDEVTLHVGEAVTSAELLIMIEEVLSFYDVGLARSNDIMHVLPASKIDAAMPAIANSQNKALAQLGRVMEFIPLKYASPNEVLSFARQFIDAKTPGSLLTYARFNAVLVIGKTAQIQRFRQAIAMVDRPSLKDKYLRLVYPVYWDVAQLTQTLTETLQAQGIPFEAQNIRGGIKLIPISEINAMMIVSPDKAWLSSALGMIKKLDIPKAIKQEQKHFIYLVKNTKASDLGKIISRVISGKGAPLTDSYKTAKGLKSKDTAPMESKKIAESISPVASQGRLAIIIDKERNALIFVGKAKDYRDILPLLQQLDKPAYQVLIEATIAEVKVNDAASFGVEFGASGGNVGNLKGTISTAGGLGVGSAGLVYNLVNADGLLRVKMNALASQGKARILASPRLLAINNEIAHIQIGDQIAILSQEVGNATASTDTDTALLRSFTYVDTGIILDVTPTIYQDGQVRLKIYQEVSTPGASSNNTPPISKRSVKTELVAQSGQTVMIGGLISRNQTKNDVKVPILGDIPLLGHLFASTSTTDNDSELIILITPHIIKSASDADYLRRAFQKSLNWDKQP